MQELPTAAADHLAAISSRIIDAQRRGDQLPPAAVMFLLRRYLVSPDDHLAPALGLALAAALDAPERDVTTLDRAAWLTVLVEAATVADDERVAPAVAALVAALQAGWPGEPSGVDAIIGGAAAVQACLLAAPIVGRAAIVPPAIDELERVVGAAYRPGSGLLGGVAPAHVGAASALLTAFEATGRLPYSMLAEELMQPVRRTIDAGAAADDCAAARVLCRLAVLHLDADYRAAAVIAPGVDYQADAGRMLRWHAANIQVAPVGEAALYGLALGELISLR